MPYLQQDSPVRQSDYTCDEYARRFNLSPTTVRNKVSRGEIPSYKIGGARRIPAEYVASIDRIRPVPITDEEWVEEMLVKAPRLTREQRTRLAELLEPVRVRRTKTVRRTA